MEWEDILLRVFSSCFLETSLIIMAHIWVLWLQWCFMMQIVLSLKIQDITHQCSQLINVTCYQHAIKWNLLDIQIKH